MLIATAVILQSRFDLSQVSRSWLKERSVDAFSHALMKMKLGHCFEQLRKEKLFTKMLYGVFASQVVASYTYGFDDIQGQGFIVHLNRLERPFHIAEDFIVNNQLLGRKGYRIFQMPNSSDSHSAGQYGEHCAHRLVDAITSYFKYYIQQHEVETSATSVYPLYNENACLAKLIGEDVLPY